jgi:hypothetical protein
MGSFYRDLSFLTVGYGYLPEVGLSTLSDYLARGGPDCITHVAWCNKILNWIKELSRLKKKARIQLTIDIQAMSYFLCSDKHLARDMELPMELIPLGLVRLRQAEYGLTITLSYFHYERKDRGYVCQVNGASRERNQIR